MPIATAKSNVFPVGNCEFVVVTAQNSVPKYELPVTVTRTAQLAWRDMLSVAVNWTV